jgi:hypothetical protein
MIEIPLPNHHSVTIHPSANGSPPDRQGGMSTNSATLWIRLRGPDRDSGWVRCHDKSWTKVRNIWLRVLLPFQIEGAWHAERP